MSPITLFSAADIPYNQTATKQGKDRLKDQQWELWLASLTQQPDDVTGINSKWALSYSA